MRRALAPLIPLAVLALGGQSATAQTVQPCDDARSNAWNIAEPWESNSRLFAKGAVRLALIDTIEPAAAAFHLLILSPPYDELGGRQCRVVSMDGATGFAGLDLTTATASYDPAKGLTIALPAKRYVPDVADFAPATLRIILNQSTGDTAATLE